ncbi:MAG TPA: amylo-alpha-1,6-glucosidase [Rhizomicrobium sp.]|jgi:glycogen debranching enzyme|nr:amylo-alpha-1,6-glucosidase [Rhizomicrobium sp.]
MEAKPLPPAPDETSSFYIQATESIQERWPRILKSGDTFGLFDALGDVIEPRISPGGLFHNDTRHLSGLEFLINGQRPVLLSSAVENDNVVLTVDLSNPDIYENGKIVLPRETLHVRRSKFLWLDTAYERFAIHNFDTRSHRCIFTFNLAADFRDLFEIRGIKRAKRGEITTQLEDQRLIFRYQGLDGITRITDIHLDPKPDRLSESHAAFALDLKAGEQCAIVLTVRCGTTDPRTMKFSEPYRAARRAAQKAAELGGTVTSSNALANRMMHRAGADLSMLITQTAEGPYPYAGTPWFSTPFGRDGLITALQMLWIDPSIAKGVLRYLARTQATKIDPKADAEPGKILHETRACEMANLGEVPFGRYYGSIDSTPLFVLLASRYFMRTGDQVTIRALWPHLTAALEWIDRYGDRDGDGFVEYYRESEDGLTNQGWKDSYDSIFHEDGQLATGSIALCEVQAYVYAAKKGAAMMGRMLGEHAHADQLDDAAEKLRVKFEAAFWCEELGVYAIALDGEKKPCRVRTSNAGQVLVGGIASPERAARLAETLMTPEMFSGWGVRTVASDAPRYNPMAYHDGSVWPHDNSLIALGLGRYGFKRAAAAIFEGMFNASTHMELMRFPELFCGFSRRRGTAPTLYPVACQPQAWASAAPFALLEACLGIVCDHAKREIRFHNPLLPQFLEEIRIHNLILDGASADLCLRRRGEGTEVAILAQRGDVSIRIAQ